MCVIIPTNADDALKKGMAKNGIAAISPGWTYEQIVAELANQQRMSRSLAKALG